MFGFFKKKEIKKDTSLDVKTLDLSKISEILKNSFNKQKFNELELKSIDHSFDLLQDYFIDYFTKYEPKETDCIDVLIDKKAKVYKTKYDSGEKYNITVNHFDLQVDYTLNKIDKILTLELYKKESSYDKRLKINIKLNLEIPLFDLINQKDKDLYKKCYLYVENSKILEVLNSKSYSNKLIEKMKLT